MGLYDWDRMKAEEITDLYQRKVAIGESITLARVEVKEGAVTQAHSHENEEMILVFPSAERRRDAGAESVAPHCAGS